MTSRRVPPSGQRGETLAVAIFVVLILAAVAAASMRVAVQDQRRTSAEAARVRLQYIADAGINHAVDVLTTGGDANLGSSGSPIAFGGGSYVTTATSLGSGTWLVRCEASLDEESLALEVILAPVTFPLFTKALFGDLDLAAKGHVFTDSYDSDLGTYADQAIEVDPVTGRTYAKANGTLGSNGNIYINGSVTILGDATPGPGKSVYINGGSSHIAGSTAPAATTTPLPAVEFPNMGDATVDFDPGASYTFTAGEYHYRDFELNANADITISGDVVLYIDDEFDVSGQARFVVPPGSSVKIYHAGADFQLTGGGMINDGGLPASFQLYTAATDVRFGGNSSFYGAIYAPHATINPSGTSQIYGSFVGSRVVIDGTADFHYDESLADAEMTVSHLRPVCWRRAGVSP